MKYFVLISKAKLMAQSMLILAIFSLSLGVGSASAATETPAAPNSCGQMLADAEARFLSTLAPDGSVPANEETRAAAQEYIRVSKLCYEEIEAQNPAGALQGETPTFIDDGGVLIGSESSAEFVLDGNGRKWGSTTLGTSGGTVTYSFMGNGLSLSAEPNSSGFGSSVSLSSLPGFQACFIADIQNAFAAWQVVSNIQFEQVTDTGSAFNASGAGGDIRIGAHTFDGPSRVLAHAYYPPPNGTSAAGDMHFDRQENWTCNTSGIDIGVVALHEIGHSLGLDHENDILAVMNSYYNPSLAGLQSDDVDGAATIYGGPAALTDPPGNDSFSTPRVVGSIPYADAIDTTGALDAGEGAEQVLCGGIQIRKGTKDVWYQFTSPTTRNVSFDTFGSDYDTYIAVWTGSNVNSLNLIACNDDPHAGFQSRLSFNAQAGVPYRIQVAQYNGQAGGSTSPPTGGNLQFHGTSFGDVAGNHWAWRWIEGLSSAGVTSGCTANPPNYCPDTLITRDQMAVFLLKAKYGSSYSPPLPSGVFQDVPTNHWAAAWIERLAAEGITAGCSVSPPQYCPSIPVTRDQMAVFLLKAKYGSSYSPPLPSGVFQDVPTNHWAAAWIERLAAEGITAGCNASPPQYCPATPVTRDQMAVFIARTYNISPLP
ncbi:MAG TPA: matrixin family metalloprotease [Anaerolineales bacterium]|nr:matrixin family metalloprotease [Anaerolineales bacterium]